MLAFVKVVGTHDAPRSTFLHSHLEGRQIDFIKGAVVHDDIGGVTVHFVVVQGKVFHAGSHTILLHAPDIGHYHLSGQIRVLTHILKVASVERCTVDIDTRAQQDRFVAVARLFTDTLSVKERHFGVPGCCQTSQGRESHTGVIGASGLFPLVPQHIGTYTVRAVIRPYIGNAQTGYTRTAELALRMSQLHFLFQGQTAQSVFHSFFNRFACVQIDGLLLG